MRESIGGTWLTGIVIVFMLIFVAFLALSINYTKAFQMKNDILTMIEKREGFTDGENGSIKLINNYLSSNGYHTRSRCEAGSYGVTDLNSVSSEYVSDSSSKQYYYCVKKIGAKVSENSKKVYYKVNIYFYFNLPVIGDIFKFNIDGTTKAVAVPADKLIEVAEE